MVEYSFDRGEFFRDRYFDSDREAMLRDREELRRMEEMRERDLPMRVRDEAVREVINNPTIKLNGEQKKAINDPTMMMDTNGNLRKMSSAERQERQRFFGLIYPPLEEPKRTRKKNGNDKLMSKALRMANDKLRTKSGRLRKGKTQRDIMRMAHRLRRKM